MDFHNPVHCDLGNQCSMFHQISSCFVVVEKSERKKKKKKKKKQKEDSGKL
jgi:hypothetical protein